MTWVTKKNGKELNWTNHIFSASAKGREPLEFVMPEVSRLDSGVGQMCAQASVGPTADGVLDSRGGAPTASWQSR